MYEMHACDVCVQCPIYIVPRGQTCRVLSQREMQWKWKAAHDGDSTYSIHIAHIDASVKALYRRRSASANERRGKLSGAG